MVNFSFQSNGKLGPIPNISSSVVVFELISSLICVDRRLTNVKQREGKVSVSFFTKKLLQSAVSIEN